MDETDEHGFYSKTGPVCCFCGDGVAVAHHNDVIREEEASRVYHDLARAVRHDQDKPSRHDGSLLNYAVAVADAFAVRHGLPNFDSIEYMPEGSC
jgi:hypothetical protein